MMTRTFVAANGDKVFRPSPGRGRSRAPPAAHSTETDTITGGTGRPAGTSGTYKDTISSVVVSVTATSQTSIVTAVRGNLTDFRVQVPSDTFGIPMLPSLDLGLD